MASRKNWSLLLTGLLTVGVILIGCPNPNNPESSTGKATERYATVPYEPAAGTSAAADDLRKLIYSGYEGGTSADTADSYYYVFLLGHINKVPMAYRQAIEYNGTTPITIGYARTESTETSVTETLETATEHSVERGGEIGWEAGIESTIKVKEVFEQKISASVSGSQSWNESTTRSTSRSYETMTAKMNESSDTIEATIGEHDEAAGKYRYSYFATTDVYYVLKTDKSKQVVGGYFAVCARGNSFAWGIDYEPDLGGDFGKTGAGALLKVPAIVNTPSSLPTPENENDLNQILSL